MRLIERGAPAVVDALNVSGDFTTATASVNMKNYNRCLIVYKVTTSGASNATIALKQGSTSTANTALAFSEFAKIEAGTATPMQWTKVTASSLTTAAPSAGTHLYAFEVKAEDLDNDTFGSENTYVRANVSGSANVTAASLEYFLYEPRDVRSSDGFPSAA